MKRSRLRSRSFSERYPEAHDGPRYGPLFRALRDHAKRGGCRLEKLGYRGAGHDGCGIGNLPATAHHVGEDDMDGMIECCGRAHDLFHGRASLRTQEYFDAWLDSERLAIEQLGRDGLSLAESLLSACPSPLAEGPPSGEEVMAP